MKKFASLLLLFVLAPLASLASAQVVVEVGHRHHHHYHHRYYHHHHYHHHYN